MNPVSSIKNIVAKALRICIGRKQLIRCGRFMGNAGMLRGPNDPRINGEFDYLAHVLDSSAVDSGNRPIVVDIGANLGVYSSHVSKLLNGQGRVFAAEPCKETMARLMQNTSNLPTKVEYLHVAFSDRDGNGRLFVVGSGAGTNSLEGEVTPTDNTENVTLLTLDSFLDRESIDEIDFVKIDTEGHDLSVIRGAKRSLESRRIRALQFEYNWRWIGQRSFLKDVFAVIGGTDYHLGRVTPAGIEVLDSWNPSLETLIEDNYAVYRSDVSGQLKLISYPAT